MDLDNENIVEANFWAFGFFAKKNGDIDWKQLKDDLEQVEYYIAAFQIETADGKFFGRLAQPLGYRWVLENQSNPDDDCTEMFDEIVSGDLQDVYDRFAEHASEIVERGFNSLKNILERNPEDLKGHGISTSRVKSLVSMSQAIQKKTDNGLFHPVLKKI